jgi:hypothetical protein
MDKDVEFGQFRRDRDLVVALECQSMVCNKMHFHRKYQCLAAFEEELN